MANNEIKKIGYITSRTSNEVRQNVTTKVIGVLRYNNEIRESLLKRNIGIYELSEISEGIGYIPDFYALENSKPFSLGKEGLLGHTHLVPSVYQNNIKTKYDFDKDVEYYQFKLLNNSNSLRWNGEFYNYIQYVNKTLSSNIDENIDESINFNNSDYILNNQRVSIEPNFYTKNNNDTDLGLISNEIYIQTLKNSAYYNTARNTQYISPNIYTYVGLKSHTINELNYMFPINPFTGKLDIGVVSKTFNIESEDWEKKLEKEVRITYNGIDINGIQSPLHFNIQQNQKYKPYKPYNYTSIADETLDIFGQLVQWNTQNKSSANTNGLYQKTQNLRTSGMTGSEYSTPTQERFIDTLIDEKNTQGKYDKTHNKESLFQSAVNATRGMSHGRNLLTEDKNDYCRVWTRGSSYDSVNKTISHNKFTYRNDINTKLSQIKLKERTNSAKDRIESHSVLNSNGFVNISPIITNDNKTNIKNCMFSIENLAWKDYAERNLTSEQIGPNGGRIMWFPPYDIKFNESASAQWSANDFIGRGEKVYTYTNSERSGTLSFSLLVDHPSILNVWNKHTDTQSDTSRELDVLRYFAGCSNLDFPLPNKEDDNKENENEENEEIKVIDDGNKDIVFYVFFPNYYSGVDSSNINDVCYYLINNYDKYENSTQIYPGYYWCYRIDNKYKNKGKYNKGKLNFNNYKDINPKGLNSNLAKVQEINEDATHSFNEIINEDVLNKIKSATITITGSASSHGKDSENQVLAKNRANFIKKILENKISSDNIKYVDGKHIKDVPVTTDDKNNISGESAKRGRCAKVVISNINESDASENSENTESQETSTKETKTEKPITPWGNEAQYFEMLQSSGNILYTELVKKIKYFTPAFHSITPEGFNARLAFLHQCTRQGLTCATSDGNVKYRAGNMAFGRPPICVLRIGDFYYTKIIIDSISIDYESPQWDMNPEGIGLQPMYASISLNFKFLGGSDIEGPISRLQNAVSFNYYANQSIYDSRADIKISDKITPWSPLPTIDNDNQIKTESTS